MLCAVKVTDSAQLQTGGMERLIALIIEKLALCCVKYPFCPLFQLALKDSLCSLFVNIIDSMQCVFAKMECTKGSAGKRFP